MPGKGGSLIFSLRWWVRQTFGWFELVENETQVS